MRITRLFGFSLTASLCVSAGAMAQHTGTHSAGAPTPGTATAPAQTGQPVPSSTYADTALLTGLIGTRAPTGIATVEGRNVRVTLTGDQPGSTRAWYVHRGSCTRDEGVVGSARAYTPITIDARGSGTASVSLDVPFAVGGTYFVAVHASATDAKSETIVCGPLAKTAMASTAPGTHAMANMGNMPMSHTGNMAGMDHSAMGMTGTRMPAMAGSPSSDSTSALVLADPVIRERAMTDPVLRDMLARVPSGGEATMESGAMPGMAMPSRSQPARRAAAPAAPRSTSRSTTRSTSGSSASSRGTAAKSTQTSAKKPAATPARKPAAKPAAAPTPKQPMPSMPGMDHSKMPGMSRP
jgi:hypothetical protein